MPVSIDREFVRRLPKAELHLHLEGAIRPARLIELGRKYGTELGSASVNEVETNLFSYKDFAAFLDTYRRVCEHLLEPEDYLLILGDLARYFVDQNIRYAEVIFSPAAAWRFERDAEAILKALLAKSRELAGEGRFQIRWILDCVRQFGTESAKETARLGVRHRAEGVVALGLGGDENSLETHCFEEVFSWARANALYAHVHAGEVGGPSHIWEALKILGANRIGHGIQAARDPALMKRLRERAIGLDVCLTSNRETGAWAPISANPFWLLHQRGVAVTLNTDDPGLFKTTLVDEYLQASQAFGLLPSDLAYIALQSVRSSFLPYQEKTDLMQSFQDEIHTLLAPGEQPR